MLNTEYAIGKITVAMKSIFLAQITNSKELFLNATVEEFELRETFLRSSLYSFALLASMLLAKLFERPLLYEEFSERLSKNSKMANSIMPPTTKNNEINR